MCGRYMIKVQVNDLVERFKVVPDELAEHGPTVRYNVAPSQTMPVVIHSDGQNRLSLHAVGIDSALGKGPKVSASDDQCTNRGNT
jgi:putative SOS response-associated peptidase YedK